jgi:hypothetical protein
LKYKGEPFFPITNNQSPITFSTAFPFIQLVPDAGSAFVIFIGERFGEHVFELLYGFAVQIGTAGGFG